MKNVLVRVVHMLQDINTLMQALGKGCSVRASPGLAQLALAQLELARLASALATWYPCK